MIFLKMHILLQISYFYYESDSIFICLIKIFKKMENLQNL